MRKKIIIMSLFLIIIFSSFYNVFATLTGSFTGTITTAAEGGAQKIRDIIAVALQTVRVVGSGIAVLILMVIGCKYMISAPGERAEIKKHATTYVIGAVVLIAASGIIGIIQTFVKDNIK